MFIVNVTMKINNVTHLFSFDMSGMGASLVSDTISSSPPPPIFRVTDLEQVAPVVPHGTF